MIVPHRKVSSGALRRLIEDFVSRDGIDPGHAQVGIDQKVCAVMAQLANGSAVLVFDTASNSYNILSRDEAERRK